MQEKPTKQRTIYFSKDYEYLAEGLDNMSDEASKFILKAIEEKFEDTPELRKYTMKRKKLDKVAEIERDIINQDRQKRKEYWQNAGFRF